MKIVVFGLTVSSSWGNGHATIWRALCRALSADGHQVVFFERDVPYYASTRDLWQVPGCDLRLYEQWPLVSADAARELFDCDAAIVTSYCPDAAAAAELILGSRARARVFYDLDTPVTLSALAEGSSVFYVPPNGLSEFDLVLSFTGGRALAELRTRLGARRVAALYGCVDPDSHRPATPIAHYRADLSYLGTYAADRQPALESLFVEPARRLPQFRFLIGGAQYPPDFPWSGNIYFVRHMPPSEHPAFFSSSRITLNVTRRAMAELGYCPSGRLFEAAAVGTPILSDVWEGFEHFFTPGIEILTAHSTGDAVAAIQLSDEELRHVAQRARERTLAEHTGAQRARELVNLLEAATRATSESEALLSA